EGDSEAREAAARSASPAEEEGTSARADSGAATGAAGAAAGWELAPDLGFTLRGRRRVRREIFLSSPAPVSEPVAEESRSFFGGISMFKAELCD
ncbi:MAG: hypothetical protein DUW69_002504, partial [Verrucomicrobia bacterium]